MKKSITLVLIYFLMQALAALLLGLAGMLWRYFTQHHWAFMLGTDGLLVPTLILGFILMTIFLWKVGYLKPTHELWSPVLPSYWGWMALLAISCLFMVYCLSDWLNFLPDWLSDDFDAMESGFWGIVAIAVLGPIVEELLFRGAITRELLRRYTPSQAILASGIIFGVFHINPAQVIPAMLIGFLLAWLYYRTHSLVPGILIHVLNNGFSVWLNVQFPEEITLNQLLSTPIELGCLALAIVVSAVAFKRMCSYPMPKGSN